MAPVMNSDKLCLAYVCVCDFDISNNMQDHPENWEAVLRSIGVRSLDLLVPCEMTILTFNGYVLECRYLRSLSTPSQRTALSSCW